MRIMKRQLRRIIREEKKKLQEYGSLDAYGPDDYTTYVIRPTVFVDAAERYLTDEERAAIGQDKIERIAIDNANELAWQTADSQEGFGSSDRAAYIKYYLDDLGRYASFTTDWKGPRGSLQIVREGKMRITKRQLKRIVKEEKCRLLKEQDDTRVADNNTHHWPRVAWDDVGELVDKWTDGERKAFDKGDPSMMAMGETATEAKGVWDMQVEQAGMEMEAELTDRVRKVALQTMQEFTDNLINGDYS